MLYLRGTSRLYTLLLRIFFKFDHIGSDVVISPSCDISRRAARYIHIGDGVRLARDVWLNIPYEAPEPVKNKPIIKICSNAGIGRRCFFSGINYIEIGPNVIFGPGVFMTDHSHEYQDEDIPIQHQGVTEGGKIIIEEGCWFGHNSAVVTQKGKEIVIGKNSVISTNAVITKSFPPNSILIGIPARNVGKVAKSDRLKEQIVKELNESASDKRTK